MRPYSDDLRERILAAVDRGDHSLRQLAHLFAVSLSCIVRLLQHRRRTGTSRPKPHAGGPTPVLDAQALQRLRDLVARYPDATLAELRERHDVTVEWLPFELRPAPVPLPNLDGPEGERFRLGWERGVAPLGGQLGVEMH